MCEVMDLFHKTLAVVVDVKLVVQTVVMMMMTCARSWICSTRPWLWSLTTCMENSQGGKTCTTNAG